MTCDCEPKRKDYKGESNTPKVLQIESKEAPVLFHRIDVPSSMGDDISNPPVQGQYKNILVVYEANGHAYLFNSDGVYTQIAWGDNNNFDALINRPSYAGELMTHETNIPDVDAAVEAEAELREAADATLQADITAETAARMASDTALGNALNNETAERQENVAELSDRIDAEETAREQAVTAVSNDLEQEIADRAAADTALGSRIDSVESDLGSEASARAVADTTLDGKIDDETTARTSADTALTQALSTKANTADLATVATTGSYNDLSNTPTNLSDFTNDTNFQNTQQVSTSISNAVTPISTAINKVVMTDIDLNSTPSTSTIKLDGAKQNISTGATTTKSITMPVASSTQAGVMSSSIYDSIQSNSNNINAILNGTVAVANLPENPTQAQLTTAWQTATGLTTLINGAKIFDSTNSKTWTYYTNTTTWYAAGAGGSVTVNTATNTSQGIVQGDATVDGKVFVENDGTMSLNGWDTIVDDVADNMADIASLQTEMNGKENTVTAGTTSQYYRGDKTWQTLDKSAVSLANVDNTSDATKKSNFTGSIASGNTGFVTGGAAYTALAGKVDTVSGKGLSTNDYTTTEKNKLAGIASGAEVNVQSDWNVTSSTSDAYIKNKPTIPTVNNATLTIQRNGTSVQTFTANSATNKTANIQCVTSNNVVSTESVTPIVTTSLIVDEAVTAAKIDFDSIKTQIANLVYPVGSIFMSASLDTVAKVQNAFGGTWVAWGTGRVPVGVDTSQTEFNAADKTGGSNTNTHYHYETNSYDGSSFYATQIPTHSRTRTATRVAISGTKETANTREDATYDTTISVLQPYVTCYMYKRTA